MPYRFRPRNKPSEITPQPVYHGRRKAVASLLALPLANTLPAPSSAQAETARLPATVNDQHTLASHAYPELTPRKRPSPTTTSTNSAPTKKTPPTTTTSTSRPPGPSA